MVPLRPGTRTFTDCLPLPEAALDEGLQAAPEGDGMYVFTLRGLYRLTLDPFGFEEILRDDEAGFRTAGPVRRTADGGEKILFSRTHRLMAARLP